MSENQSDAQPAPSDRARRMMGVRDPVDKGPDHGHRKLAFASLTMLGGEIAGQDIVKFFWDAIALIGRSWEIPLQPMPEDVAAGVFAILAALVFYQTRETS